MLLNPKKYGVGDEEIDIVSDIEDEDINTASDIEEDEEVDSSGSAELISVDDLHQKEKSCPKSQEVDQETCHILRRQENYKVFSIKKKLDIIQLIKASIQVGALKHPTKFKKHKDEILMMLLNSEKHSVGDEEIDSASRRWF
ncbi:hypothetical protein A4A49_34634 [Nicotiana attenuata]|uniref:Uncharacterized protein n=1 Tax=Nicotiana attenuata TaxID=49451 RepID=A0A314LHU4_NICAT|nr:hypothetical protein A4A49_34634 [Nicotiana attenuata]